VSESLLIAVFLLIAAAIGGLFMLLFQHVKECREVREKLTRIAMIAESIKVEIGDHSSGIRGQLHDHRKHLVRLAGKVPGGLEVFD
jgi:hypothetical protein